MSNELLYNQLYERTKEFGRSQFVREIMRLERENNQLKEQYCERTDCVGRLGNSKKVERLLQENKELQEKYNIRSKAYNNILLENADLHSKIDKAIEVINKMIYQGYMNDNIQYFATGEKSEFGIRAKAILEILKDSDIDD